MKRTLLFTVATILCALFSITSCKKDDDNKKLPVLNTIKVTEITHHSAMSGGIISEDGGVPITERGICWSTSQSPTIENKKTSDGIGTGIFSLKMTDLEPETTYYVRAYATNLYGTGYGSSVFFTTKEEEFFGHPCPGIPAIIDIDGNIYNTVLVGDQCWMKENLKTRHYQDGTPIENPTDNSDWQSNTTGAFSWYDNDISWKDSYGALYNWHAVNNTNGLCPTGWRVPRAEEWEQLVSYVELHGYPNKWDNPDGAGNALKSCRQVGSPLGEDCNTTEHPVWRSNNTHHGFDRFGFSGLPGGTRYSSGGFSAIVDFGSWHSSTVPSGSEASGTYLHFSTGEVIVGNNKKAFGCSVRCLKK